jgi:hypothetical protein
VAAILQSLLDQVTKSLLKNAMLEDLLYIYIYIYIIFDDILNCSEECTFA